MRNTKTFSFKKKAILYKKVFVSSFKTLLIDEGKIKVIMIKFCSVRLTWDIFVRNLNRQLGTPSHWLPVDSFKEEQKGALAAVCTPTLKSASKKHQKLCTSVSEHRVWHSEGGKKETVCCVYFLPLAKIFPQSLVRNLKARASN